MDPKGDVATALRRCISLGGRSGSETLRTWATRELKGYGPGDELPDYRRLPAMLQLDGSNMRAIIKGQSISTWDLPEFARDAAGADVPMTQPIGELEAIVADKKRRGASDIQLSIPGGAELVTFMNSTGDG